VPTRAPPATLSEANPPAGSPWYSRLSRCAEIAAQRPALDLEHHGLERSPFATDSITRATSAVGCTRSPISVFTDSTPLLPRSVAVGSFALCRLSFLPTSLPMRATPRDHFVDFDDVVERLRDFAIDPTDPWACERKLPFRSARQRLHMRRDRARRRKLQACHFPPSIRAGPGLTPRTPGTIAKRRSLQAQLFAGSQACPQYRQHFFELVDLSKKK